MFYPPPSLALSSIKSCRRQLACGPCNAPPSSASAPSSAAPSPASSLTKATPSPFWPATPVSYLCWRRRSPARRRRRCLPSASTAPTPSRSARPSRWCSPSASSKCWCSMHASRPSPAHPSVSPPSPSDPSSAPSPSPPSEPSTAPNIGTIIFTGSSASVIGFAGYCELTCGKFALRGLSQCLAREFQSSGIHVTHVIIDGAIGSPRSSIGEQNTTLDPDALAQTYWHIHTQEIDLRASIDGPL